MAAQLGRAGRGLESNENVDKEEGDEEDGEEEERGGLRLNMRSNAVSSAKGVLTVRYEPIMASRRAAERSSAMKWGPHVARNSNQAVWT